MNLISGCFICSVSDSEGREDLKNSKGEKSPRSAHHNQKYSKIGQENSQKTTALRFGELVILGFDFETSHLDV